MSDDGTLIHVRAAGDPSRPALVFAHGFSVDMTTWHYQWKEFSKTYRCLLFDQRGHGRSAPASSGDYSLDGFENVIAVERKVMTNRHPTARCKRELFAHTVVLRKQLGSVIPLEDRSDLLIANGQTTDLAGGRHDSYIFRLERSLYLAGWGLVS